MSSDNYPRGIAPAGLQVGWPEGSNPNMYSVPTRYGGNPPMGPAQYMQQSPAIASGGGFYPQQVAGAVHGGSPMLARSQFHQQQQFQQPVQQANFQPMPQQPQVYQTQHYQPQQQLYQQGYQQQGYQQQQQPFQQQQQQFQHPQIRPFQQQQQPTAQIDPAVARKQQEKAMRDAQKKKEFEEQKIKLRSMVVGAPAFNPVEALFGKSSPPTVKKGPVTPINEPLKGQQNTVDIVRPAVQDDREKWNSTMQQQLENVNKPSVDQLLLESLNSLDLKKGSPKVKRFQQKSFQTQATTQQSTFVSSTKARNWSTTDELSGVFSEGDEFTEFAAASLGSGQVSSQLIQAQPQSFNQAQQQPVQSTQMCYDDFGTFQSNAAQYATTTHQRQSVPQVIIPQTSTELFANFSQAPAVTVASSQQFVPQASTELFATFSQAPAVTAASSQQFVPQFVVPQDSTELFATFSQAPAVTAASSQQFVPQSVVPQELFATFSQAPAVTAASSQQFVPQSIVPQANTELFATFSQAPAINAASSQQFVPQSVVPQASTELFATFSQAPAVTAALSQRFSYSVPQSIIPQASTDVFVVSSQGTVSSLAPSVTGQHVAALVRADEDFGMFHSTIIPSTITPSTIISSSLPLDVNQHVSFSSSSQVGGGNRDSFGDFESGDSNPAVTTVNVTEQRIVYSSSMQGIPYWQRSIDQLPILYQDVYNACKTDDQFLDTQRLFPILSSSGLHRSLLRDIWSAVNKVQMGKLTAEELCQVLGLIALAQSGVTNPSLEEINKQTLPPVPQLTWKATDKHEHASTIEVGTPILSNEGSGAIPTTVDNVIASSSSSAVATTTTSDLSDTDKYDVFKVISEPVITSEHLKGTSMFSATVPSLDLSSFPAANVITEMSSQSSAPTSRPFQDHSFEFGDFQGSSTVQNNVVIDKDNWAPFGNAFQSNQVPTAFISQTTAAAAATTTTTTATQKELFTATTGSNNAYLGGPGQLAVINGTNFSSASTNPSVSSDSNSVPIQSGDKYAAFDSVRLDAPMPSAVADEYNEFGHFEAGQPPTKKLNSVTLEQYPTQMEILEKCLQACDNTLSTAASILSQVKETSVLKELFTSSPGINKAQGYFEVFKLAKRVASTAVQLDGETFSNIKKHWKKIVQAFPPGLLTKLSNSGSSPSVKPHSVKQDQKCSICLFGSKILIPGDAFYQRDLFIEGEAAYHVVCANMWLNLISERLPVTL